MENKMKFHSNESIIHAYQDNVYGMFSTCISKNNYSLKKNLLLGCKKYVFNRCWINFYNFLKTS